MSALDLFADRRIRAGVWPLEAHRRGFVRLPWASGGDPAGTVLPAWVCCHCGGVDLSEFNHERNHGCCTRPDGCGSLRQLAFYASQGAPVEAYRPLDALWIPS